MQKIVFFTIIFSSLGMIVLNAQNLQKHHWKHRIVLVMADSFENESLKDQIANFKKEEEGLSERKIIIYEVTPHYYKKEGINNAVELGKATIFEEYHTSSQDFTMVLIGLDGGIKKKYQKPQPSKELFDIIDSMPMRRQEMEN